MFHVYCSVLKENSIHFFLKEVLQVFLKKKKICMKMGEILKSNLLLFTVFLKPSIGDEQIYLGLFYKKVCVWAGSLALHMGVPFAMHMLINARDQAWTVLM